MHAKRYDEGYLYMNFSQKNIFIFLRSSAVIQIQLHIYGCTPYFQKSFCQQCELLPFYKRIVSIVLSVVINPLPSLLLLHKNYETINFCVTRHSFMRKNSHQMKTRPGLSVRKK